MHWARVADFTGSVVKVRQRCNGGRTRLGFDVRLKTQAGVHGARIAFLREVTNPTQTREVFVEMVKQARQA